MLPTGAGEPRLPDQGAGADEAPASVRMEVCLSGAESGLSGLEFVPSNFRGLCVLVGRGQHQVPGGMGLPDQQSLGGCLAPLASPGKLSSDSDKEGHHSRACRLRWPYPPSVKVS